MVLGYHHPRHRARRGRDQAQQVAPAHEAPGQLVGRIEAHGAAGGATHHEALQAFAGIVQVRLRLRQLAFEDLALHPLLQRRAGMQSADLLARASAGVDLGWQQRVIEHQQRIAGRHALALGHQQLHHHAVGAGAHLGAGRRLQHTFHVRRGAHRYQQQQPPAPRGRRRPPPRSAHAARAGADCGRGTTPGGPGAARAGRSAPTAPARRR